VKLDHLKTFDLLYVGTPYTKYPGSIHHAFLDACKVTERLLRAGLLNVYSPIVHSHSLAVYGNLDPLDHTIWLPFNNAIMHKSDAMLVAMMPSWESSTGLRHEIVEFVAAGKPVYFMSPDDLSYEP
jgi:hypothetical protein